MNTGKYNKKNNSESTFMIIFLVIFALCFVPFMIKSKNNKSNEKQTVKNQPVTTTVSEETTTPQPEKSGINFDYKNSNILTADDIRSESAILYDVSSNTVLFSKNKDKISFPASTTKIMTAYIALKYLPEDYIITVGPEITLIKPDSSTAYLSQGNVISLKDALHALMLPSGNDAAYTIAVNTARYVSEDPAMTDEDAVKYFCDLMNETATEIGAENTHFCNPDGYHDLYHYTTAEDLLRIALKSAEIPLIAEISSAKYHHINIKSGEEFFWSNGNSLIVPDSEYYVPFATGLKTGFTDEAGYCMVATADYNGKKLVAVIMKAGSVRQRYIDAANLLYSETEPDKIKIEEPVTEQTVTTTITTMVS